MKIYMTDEQARQLATFLKNKRLDKERALGRSYEWVDMAAEIHIGVELLRKIKDGKKVGLHSSTVAILRGAFGPIIYEIMGFPDNSVGTFTIEEEQGDDRPSA